MVVKTAPYARCATLLLVVFILAVWPVMTYAAPVYDYEETILENGLRVVTVEDFSCPIVAVHLWYHVGSKNEQPGRQGFAHMFEHMMFRGTDRLGPEEHFRYVQMTGGSCNAMTSFDYTAYVNTAPASQLDMLLWLEVERMLFLRVTQENFDVERQVVIEERRQNLNEPYGTIFERIMPVVYHEHPYRWLPIGKIAHLEAAHVDELQRFWDTYYVPANATLVIVGAVKHKEAQEAAERYFGWIPSLATPSPVTVTEPRQDTPREASIPEPHGPAPLLRLIYRGVPASHEDAVPLQVLADILGGGESSRLYQELVKEQRLCQEAFAGLWTLEQDGLLMAGAELAPGGDMEAVLPAMQNQIARLIAEPVTERELEKVKNQYRRRIVTGALTVMDRAQALGNAVIEHGSPEWLNKQLEAIDRVTVDDVQRAAQTYLVDTGRTTVRVLPDPDASSTEEASQADPPAPSTGPLNKEGIQRPEWFPETPPVGKMADSLPESDIHEVELPNGLKVVVMPNREMPFVTVMLAFRNGPWTEDVAKPGTASMAFSMLTKGTEQKTSAELAELLEYNALTLDGSAGYEGRPSMDTGSVTATSLADKLPIAVELLAEVVRQPAFPQEELDILKDQLRLELSVNEQDPSYLAERALRRVLYGAHPYARVPSGELADLDKVDVDSVRQWWKTWARPENAVLYFAGDVRLGEARRLAKRFLGDWKSAEPMPEPVAYPLPARTPTHIYIVDRPGSVQTQIRAGQLSIKRGHPLYHASRVYGHILGSGFNSRLNRVLRIEKGLTYAVWGALMAERDAGVFQCGTFTRTETTADAVRALIEVIDGMKASPPQGPELDQARTYLVGSFARQLEMPQDVMGYQWLIESQKLPEDYLNQAIESYKATQTDDLIRVAEETVNTGELAIVVVGEASAFREQLESIAPVTVLQAP